MSRERYVWSLTYTAGTGECGGYLPPSNNGDDDIPGFSVSLLIAVTVVGVGLLTAKSRKLLIKR